MLKWLSNRAGWGIGNGDGESPGPYAGCPESERLEAVKVVLELGNDINAHADLGDYPMEGDGQYLLLNYPLNINNIPQNSRRDRGAAEEGNGAGGLLTTEAASTKTRVQ